MATRTSTPLVCLLWALAAATLVRGRVLPVGDFLLSSDGPREPRL